MLFRFNNLLSSSMVSDVDVDLGKMNDCTAAEDRMKKSKMSKMTSLTLVDLAQVVGSNLCLFSSSYVYELLFLDGQKSGLIVTTLTLFHLIETSICNLQCSVDTLKDGKRDCVGRNNRPFDSC